MTILVLQVWVNLYASRLLTMVDLCEEVKAEFKERKGDCEYEGIIPPGPPPVQSDY